VCACSLLARTAHALYSIAIFVLSSFIILHYFIKGAILYKKKDIERKMCVFTLSTAFAWNFSHSKKILQDTFIVFEKYSRIKFYENPYSGSPVVPCGRTNRRTDRQTEGRTDIHDKTNRSFSQFCTSALSPLSAYTVHLHFLYFSENKQRLFPLRQCLLCGKG
jgi:hypothetical protein